MKCCTLHRPAHESIQMSPKLTLELQSLSLTTTYPYITNYWSIIVFIQRNYIEHLEWVQAAIQLPDPTINICTDSLSVLSNIKIKLVLEHTIIIIIIIKITYIIARVSKNIIRMLLWGHQLILELMEKRK